MKLVNSEFWQNGFTWQTCGADINFQNKLLFAFFFDVKKKIPYFFAQWSRKNKTRHFLPSNEWIESCHREWSSILALMQSLLTLKTIPRLGVGVSGLKVSGSGSGPGSGFWSEMKIFLYILVVNLWHPFGKKKVYSLKVWYILVNKLLYKIYQRNSYPKHLYNFSKDLLPC